MQAAGCQELGRGHKTWGSCLMSTGFPSEGMKVVGNQIQFVAAQHCACTTLTATELFTFRWLILYHSQECLSSFFPPTHALPSFQSQFKCHVHFKTFLDYSNPKLTVTSLSAYVVFYIQSFSQQILIKYPLCVMLCVKHSEGFSEPLLTTGKNDTII